MRLIPNGVDRDLYVVSIHASVKDATNIQMLELLRHNVSIHASVKDATCMFSFVNWQKSVSIHASVKDATLYHQFVVIQSMFQSTHL